MATLSLHGLAKNFGTVAAVQEIDLDVRDGEFLCLLGPSGCGKTTALRLIAGFETPSGGDIRIDDESILGYGPSQRPTAMVFQQYTLWPHMTVYQNIAYGLRLRRQGRDEIQDKVTAGLELVNLPGYEKRYPSQLSGGQQQRVSLARALVLEPKILLLDEPFSSLDAALRLRLREELLRIQRRLRITTIFVTHDQEEALSLADRIALMQGGQIEQLDAPSRMYAWPRTLFAADFIGAMNLLPASWQGDQLQVGALALPQPPTVHQDIEPVVAVRPEDFKVSLENGGAGWPGVVEQAMDMGHYRKLLVAPSGAEQQFTVYAAKSLPVEEGVEISVQPTRYLIYVGDDQPREVNLGEDPAD